MDRISGQGIAAKAAAEMAAINGSMTTPPSRMMGSKNFSSIHLKSQTRHKHLESSPSTKQLLQSVSSIAAASGSGQPDSMLGSRRIPVSLNKSALVTGAQQRKNISTSTFEQRKSSYHIDSNANLGDALPNYQQTLLASQAQNRMSKGHLSVPRNSQQKVESVKITKDGKFIRDVAINKQIKLKLKYTVPEEEGSVNEGAGAKSYYTLNPDSSENKQPVKQEEEPEFGAYRWPANMYVSSRLILSEKNIEATEEYLEKAKVFHHLW